MFEHDHLPTIAASRVALRWLTERDVGALYAIFSDPEVTRFWSTPPMTETSEAEKLLSSVRDHFRDKTLFEWGVVRNDDDLVIGTCTLAHVDVANRRAELGFALSSAHWGRGYMQEALDALLVFSFDVLDFHRLEADVDPRNEASIRLLEKLGFRREGHLRERWLVGGDVADSLFYGLLQNEWRAKNEKGAVR